MDIARSSLKLFIANIGASVVSFLGITYFARELGATAMGIFFLFQALLGLLSLPANFGLRGAVEKRISEGDAPDRFLGTAIALKFIPITIIGVLILILDTYINQYLGAPLAGYLVLGIILKEAAELTVVILKGELRVGETAVLQFIRQFVWVGVGIILIQYGLDAISLVFGLLAALSVMVFWGWYKRSVSLGAPSMEYARSLVNYGKYDVVSSIGGYFYSWMDIALIGLFLSQSHVGAYETAWRVTGITVLFSTSIASTIFPQISQWDAENAKQKTESVLYEAITPSVILVIPAFFGIVVFSHEILALTFGSEFTIASKVMIILAAEKILQSIHMILGRVLQAINHPDLAARAAVISIVVNFILNIILIISLGLIGAAIATAVSFAINTLLHGFYLSRFINIRFPYSEVIWCTIAAGGMALFLYSLKMAMPVTTFPKLCIAIVLGIVIYGTFLGFHSRLRKKSFRQLKNVLN